MTEPQKIDCLTKDDPIDECVTSQRWVCLSFLSPEGIRNLQICED